MTTITAVLAILALQAPDTSRTPQAAPVEAPDTFRTVHASPIPSTNPAPVLDGRLDDPVWITADVAEGFYQFDPEYGQPASQATEVRVAYTEDAVFVGMRLYDTAPDSIVSQLARRDQQGIYSDWAHVAIDSYNDNRTAFRFAVNPRGVKVDAFHFGDSDEDMSWDAVWDVATAVDSLGWVAEFRIPFSQLRYSTKGDGEQRWGIGFARNIARLDEFSLWTLMPANSNRIVSSFGGLTGIVPRQSPERIELQPYTVGQLTRAPGERTNPYYSPTDAAVSIGADMKYRLTSDLTLSATLNPDFGQVEADPAVVNLSAYETFFPERRPFFVEGADVFRFGIGIGDGDSGNEQLFYSRRIGRRPQYSVNAGGGYVDSPEASTILAAAKVSGKTSNGWSLGLLDAVTAREEARYITPGGTQELTRTVEPMTNYSVLRGLRTFNDGESGIGGILTTTHRRLEDHLSFLPSASYAGGFDARHRFGENFELRGVVLGSRVEGDSTAIDRLQRSPSRYFQRPDADHVDYDPSRTSLNGWMAIAEFMKTGGHWNYGIFTNAKSPGFEVNDLGFQRDADFGIGALWLSYSQYEPGPLFRSWRINANQWSGVNFAGDRVARGGNVNGGFELPNFWSMHLGINREAESISTGKLRGGPSIIAPGSTSLFTNISSDRRKTVRLSLNGGFSREDETGGNSWRVGTFVEVRPSNQMSFSLSPSYNENVSAWQYVGSSSLDSERHYLLGRLDQRTVALTTRLSYTFTPALSLQFYAQPFVSAGQYSDFRYVANPRASGFDSRLPIFAGSVADLEYDAERDRYNADLDGDGTADAAFGNPDFNFKQLRSNAVLRWEYRPGSTLFVVWSQGRSGHLSDGSFSPNRDFRRLFGMDDEFGLPATNVLLIKLNYWLNL